MEFSTEQRRAIEYCTDLKRRAVSVTGQAGTGKTTIMKEAVDHLKKKGRSVALAAPTGRAARRISEATGHKAVTLHRLLEYGKPVMDEDTGLPRESTFPAKDKDNPLSYQDIFVDEYMMVNEELHRNLFDALPPGGRLLAFGDVHQLPPIEEWEVTGLEGAPFERLLQSKRSSVTLDIVFRQEGDSGILYNAQRIRNGLVPFNRVPDFTIKISEVPIHDMSVHVAACLESGIDYSTLDNQIITPARKGAMGCIALSSVLQSFFRPMSSDSVSLPRDKWFEKHPVNVSIGDKVICNENLYDLRDFFERFTRWNEDGTPVWSSYIPCPDPYFILNGEVGLIKDILPDGSLEIEVSDRTVQMPALYRDYIPRFNRVYDRDPRKKLDLGYAITTHKMQGSECENVVFMMHRTINYAINRNNYYTAVTRAKKSVHVITDQASLVNGPRYSAAQKQKAKALQKKGWKLEV